MRKIPNKMVMALCTVFVMPLSGCITSQGNFTAVSTRDIDWSRAGEFKQGMEWIEGRDACYIIIIIPTKSHVLIDRAVENALDKVPGAVALLDVSVKQIIICIPFIFMKDGYLVKGRALIDPRRADDDGDSSLGEEEP